MNRLAQIFSLGILLSFCANAPSLAATLIDEDFSDISDWTDLSTAVSWGDNLESTSAFTTKDGAVQLTSDAFKHTGYTAPNSLKTFTALDQKFLSPIDHASTILTIDFRARWNSVVNSGSGENGRFIVSLNYDYPEGGLDTTLDDKYDDFDQAWWARPAYHLRMRSGSTSNTQGTTLLQYGGGLTSAGEYEAFDNPSTSQSPDWWLPGFISGAGGVAPGTDTGYPNNSWVETETGVATTFFSNYRYTIEPDVQKFWFDANNNGFFEDDELQAMMPLPLTNENGAPLYQYFPTFEGIRLYWRGAGGENKGQVFLDNLAVTAESLNPSISDSGVSLTAGASDESPAVEDASSTPESSGEPSPVEVAASTVESGGELTFVSEFVHTLAPLDEAIAFEPLAAIAPPSGLTFSPELLPTANYLRASSSSSAPLGQSVSKAASVPEPSQTFALIGLAGLGLLSRYKRQRI